MGISVSPRRLGCGTGRRPRGAHESRRIGRSPSVRWPIWHGASSTLWLAEAGVVVNPYVLPARLLIGTAWALRDELLQLPAGEALALDASEVVAVDTAGLQVLLSAARTARARGGDRKLVRPSPAMQRILELT